MGRLRKAIRMIQDGGLAWCGYFWHPLKRQTVRISFGRDSGTAQAKLDWLNRIFLKPENWDDPPGTIPKEIRDMWFGEEVEVKQPKRARPSLAALRALGDAKLYKELYEAEVLKSKALRKELEYWRGRKLRDGPCPTLREAFDRWVKNYKGRDADSTANQKYDLERFMKHFDPGIAADCTDDGREMEVDYFNGRELELSEWIHGLTKSDGKVLSGGRRNQIRGTVLKMLDDAGASINRALVVRAGKRAMRAGRGAIRWLERSQAVDMAHALPAPWKDYFRVQLALGFRPDELITLKRSDFHGGDFAIVSLSPLKHLTLKLGTRTLNVPVQLKELLERRFAENECLFPDPNTGKPWKTTKVYNRKYHKELKAAAAVAGVKFKVDCRTARRTAASIWLRDGVSVARVAAVLGDDENTIREHYATILPDEVEASSVTML